MLQVEETERWHFYLTRKQRGPSSAHTSPHFGTLGVIIQSAWLPSEGSSPHLSLTVCFSCLQSHESRCQLQIGTCHLPLDFPGSSDGKESACNAGDPGSVPGSGRSTGEGNGNLLQYSCMENPMDRGAWWATVHAVAKSWTRLSN